MRIVFLLFMILGIQEDVGATPSAEALLRQQQDLYHQKAWDAFFGGAYYIRASSYADIKDHSLALEIMALSRHCQWAVIQDLSAFLENQPQMKLSQKAFGLIKMKQQYKRFIDDSQNPSQNISVRIKDMRESWPVQATQILKLKDPSSLRLHVRSLCD